MRISRICFYKRNVPRDERASGPRASSHARRRQRLTFCLYFQTARGHTPDLAILDEAGFISPQALLSLIPLMAIDGTKQIHTTSPAKNAWISKLADLKNPVTGEPHIHLIAQQFKCNYHASDSDITCPCMDLYRPDHMTVDHRMKDLLNLVDPGAFDFELTGCVAGAETSFSGVSKPFTEDLLKRFLTAIPEATCDDYVESFYVGVDPTFCTGSMSNVGCASVVKMKPGSPGPGLLVVGLDAVVVEDLDHVIHMVHSHLVLKHVAGLKALFPTAFERAPVVFVVERNLFTADIALLTQNISNAAMTLFKKQIVIYTDANGQTGFLTTAQSKLENVTHFVACLRRDCVGHAEACFSFANSLRSAFKRRDHRLDSEVVQIKASQESYDPLASVANPTTEAQLGDLSHHDRVRFFKRYGGIELSLGVEASDFTDGVYALETLCAKLSNISIDSQQRIPVVSTGGKRWVKGQGRERDDLVSAFLICLGRAITEEEHRPRWRTGQNRGF